MFYAGRIILYVKGPAVESVLARLTLKEGGPVIGAAIRWEDDHLCRI